MRPDLLIGLVGVVLMGAGGAGAWVLLSAGEALAEIEYSISWEREEAELEPVTLNIAEGATETAQFDVPVGNVTLFETTVTCTDRFAGMQLAPSRITVTVMYNGSQMGQPESGTCTGVTVTIDGDDAPCRDPGSLTIRASSAQDAITSANVTGASCAGGMGAWNVEVSHTRTVGLVGGQGGIAATVNARYEYYHTPTATAVTR